MATRPPVLPTTLCSNGLEHPPEARQPFRNSTQVGRRQASKHFRHMGTGSLTRLLEMLRPSRGECQDDAAAFLGVLSTAHQLASYQTVDYG
jgi:hypothetical protein